MIKNKIYIDVERTQTFRIELSEETGYDIPSTMVEFAEFYSDVKMNPWDFIDENKDFVSTSATETKSVAKVWIKN